MGRKRERLRLALLWRGCVEGRPEASAWSSTGNRAIADHVLAEQGDRLNQDCQPISPFGQRHGGWVAGAVVGLKKKVRDRPRLEWE